jgi:hypothetical protein
LLNVLVEGYHDSKILQGVEMNPLKIQPIRLRPASHDQPASATVSDTNKTVKRVGSYLVEMLRIQYEEKKVPIAGLSAQEAVVQLNRQIRTYSQGTYPFDQDIGEAEEPEDWWKTLIHSPHAGVLAVRLIFALYQFIL